MTSLAERLAAARQIEPNPDAAQWESDPDALPQLSSNEDREEEFGLKFEQPVTVTRSSGETEENWRVARMFTNDEGEKLVSVRQDVIDDNGNSLYKTIQLEELLAVQPKVTETSSAFSLNGVVERWNPDNVAGADRLLHRESLLVESNEQAAAVLASREALPSSPEQAVESVVATPETFVSHELSPVDTATSRIGRFMQRLSDRVENGASRADSASEYVSDKTELAKTKLRGIGRVGARFSRAGHEIAAGARVVVTNKALEVSDRVDAVVFNAAESATNAVKDKVSAASNRAGDAIMNGFASVENGLDKGAAKVVEFKAGVKEKLIARKQAAITRRQARRERWATRRTSAKKAVTNGFDRTGEGIMKGFATLETGVDKVGNKMINAKEAAADKAERAKLNLQATRAIGRAAIDARQAE